MEPRVAVVTGATAGLGRFVALGVARAGWRVVLVGRSRERGEAVRALLAAEAPGVPAELECCDLSSLADTRALGERIAARHGAVGLLVNNAGCFLAHREETAEGHERVLATNHLAPWVLTRALLPALRAAAARDGEARVVNVGSSASDGAEIDPEDLELRRGWGLVRAYSRSKLALMMGSFALARELSGDRIAVNVVHPGPVATSLVRERGVVGLAWTAMAPFLLSERQGADTPLHVALAPELRGVSGRYFKRRRAVRPNRRALDAGLVARVEAATRGLVG